jgi:S-adenosylmethionine hydrolase
MPSSPAPPGPAQLPSGVVSLTTDFGITEPFVGLVKAQILARHPAARIVDLTHAIAPFCVEAAAFWIGRSYRFFPPGSLHLVIVDPGVGTSRRILAVAVDGHMFLGPDNGVLGPLAGRTGASVRAVDRASLTALGVAEPSPTFHGRDIFAPLAGALSAGELPFGQLGSACDDWTRPTWPAVERAGTRLRGRVILVDTFGNCFSNIDGKSIVPYEVLKVTFGAHQLAWVRTYGERPAGTGVALINAFGVLEAACVEASAARRLGLAPGAAVEVELGRLSPGVD